MGKNAAYAAQYAEEAKDAEVLRESVGRIFASKGEEVVQMNYRAFDIGHEYVKQLKF